MQTTTDTLRATHVVGPGERRSLPPADNAFRLLGLSGRASQSEIYAAASTLRRAIELGVAKTPAHHLGWLGPLDLTENAVRDALSRLAIPSQRIYERLFWFFDPQALASSALTMASLQESTAGLQSIESPSARHDRALLSLGVMLRIDPALKLAAEWRRTYAFWKEVIEGTEFWSLLMASELKGDFEQLATFGEIGDLRGRAWRLVTSPLAEMAKDAIISEDHARAGRALGVLRASGLPEPLAVEYENEILGPVEDTFDVLLSVAFGSYRYEVKSDQSVVERRATCWRAHATFNEQIRPALKNILDLAGADSPVARRAFAAAAEALDELAEGFESGYDVESKIKALRRAWQLAPPESASLLLIEEHLAAAGDVGERPPKTEADYARQLDGALREPAARPELFTAYIRKEEAEKHLDAWGKGAMKFVIFVVLALFVGKCFNSLPGPRRTGIYQPMNFNVAMPRFTPLPEIGLNSLVDHVTASELRTMLQAKTVTLLHVGARGEYETGHIPGALSMPEQELAARAKRLPKYRRVVLYCYCTGQEASRRGSLLLQTLGFINVSVLEGGYQAWLDAGFPVRQAAPDKRIRKALVRQGREDEMDRYEDRFPRPPNLER